jgi:hypothetical protein
MSDGRASYAPQMVAKVNAKKAELHAAVAAGEMTQAEAMAAYKAFVSLSIAHVREHGPERP